MGGSLKKDFVYLTFVRKHCWVGFFIWFVLSFVCFGLFVLHEQLRPYSSRFLWFSPVISSGCPRFSQQEGTSQQLLLYAHSWTICNTNCWGGCHQRVISECSWAELNEAPAETKPIICQNSKPWSRFRKVQMIFQASIQNPPKQPQTKAAANTEAPGWVVGTTKNCGWWINQRCGRTNLNGSSAFPRLSGPLFPPHLWCTKLTLPENVPFSRCSCHLVSSRNSECLWHVTCKQSFREF